MIAETPGIAGAVSSRRLPRLLLVAMRPLQWTTNLFVLATLLFGMKLTDAGATTDALIAFACFCLLASALYLVNDVLDADLDRAHPQKRLRPIASGELPVPVALAAVGALLAAAAAVAVSLGR
ncbi:MAG: UbiA family prenyltransferase, partial [Gemmatimonadota bacterium]